MKMMLISQNIILMPVKRKIVTKRKAIGGAAQSLDRLTQGLHHAHPPLKFKVQVQVPFKKLFQLAVQVSLRFQRTFQIPWFEIKIQLQVPQGLFFPKKKILLEFFIIS